ncbi:hypothetical protein BS78_02G180300 [Paspalum vaginatum]|nr:hypothetical protein BS78_02G180300 [Paspalum vaginatum]
MAPSHTFTGGEALKPGSRIFFGSFDFITTATGELRLACPASPIDALTQGMGGLRLAEPPRDVVMAEAGYPAPANPDIETLADCAGALLHVSSTREDCDQVLYTFANVVTQLHGNPPLPSLAELRGDAPRSLPATKVASSPKPTPAKTKAGKQCRKRHTVAARWRHHSRTTAPQEEAPRPSALVAIAGHLPTSVLDLLEGVSSSGSTSDPDRGVSVMVGRACLVATPLGNTWEQRERKSSTKRRKKSATLSEGSMSSTTRWNGASTGARDLAVARVTLQNLRNLVQRAAVQQAELASQLLTDTTSRTSRDTSGEARPSARPRASLRDRLHDVRDTQNILDARRREQGNPGHSRVPDARNEHRCGSSGLGPKAFGLAIREAQFPNRATYKRPGSSWDLKGCTPQKRNELPDVTDADVGSAFTYGTTNEALIHELGRGRPKTTADLLDIAIKFADGEDAVGAIFHKRKASRDDGEGTSGTKKDRRDRRDK